MSNAAVQREAALAQARAAKARIRQIRERLGNGQLTLRDLLEPEQPDDLAAQADRTPVARLLLWTPGLGPRLIPRVLDAAGVAPSVRLGDLDTDQRRRVLAAAHNLAMRSNLRRAA